QVIHEALLDPGCEEVIEEPRCPLRAGRKHRPAGEVRLPREDVGTEVRPQEVELAARNLAAGEGRVAVPAQRAELTRHETARLEAVSVGRDVDDSAEARMCDRAVVALEKVLAGDLPVRADLELRAEAELERIHVDDLGEL